MAKYKLWMFGLWASIGIVLFLYGLMAFNAGVKVFPYTNKGENLEEKVTEVIEMAEKEIDIDNEEIIKEVSPVWMNILARISSKKYAYGKEGILTVDQYYYSIPDKRRTIISVHMMLGIILLMTGVFQFWPKFRRKYRKVHRCLGVTYIITSLVSMTLSVLHLIYAGPENIFSTFVFYVGLWALAISEFVCIGMAVLALYQKNFDVHLGWMALSFGFYLTAPVQRINWFVLSLFANGATFSEMNIMVNVTLQVQVVLLAYLLFYINRASSRLKSRQKGNLLDKKSRHLPIMAYGVAVLICTMLFKCFVYAPGFAGIQNLVSIIPESIVQHQSLIFKTRFLPILFFVTTSTLLLFSIRLSLANEEKFLQMKVERYVIICSGFLASIILFYWAFQLGMPSYEHSVAGIGYLQTGAVLLLFICLLMNVFLKGNVGLAKEFLRFVIASVASPVLVYIFLYILEYFNIVPQLYILKGHAFELSHLFSLTLPLIAVHIVNVYSNETKKYIIN